MDNFSKSEEGNCEVTVTWPETQGSGREEASFPWGLRTRIRPTQSYGWDLRAMWLDDKEDSKRLHIRNLV